MTYIHQDAITGQWFTVCPVDGQRWHGQGNIGFANACAYVFQRGLAH